MAEITDFESAKAYFETQPHDRRVLMAQRAALRVLPLIVRDKANARLTLAVLRAVLTSGASAKSTAPEFRAQLETAASASARSARSAADAAATYSALSAALSADSALSADAAADAADSAAADSAALSARSAYSAALSAYSAADSADADARSAAYSAISADAAARDFDQPVWTTVGVPTQIVDAYNRLTDYLSARPHWAFWKNWFEAAWAGQDLDDDLVIAVALIDDVIWKQGVQAVARAIDKLAPMRLRATAPKTEKVTLDPQSGLVTTISVPVAEPAHLDALIEDVGDALDDALDTPNGLQKQDAITKTLRRMLDRQRDKPQRLEMTCTRVAGELRYQMSKKVQELPDDGAHRMLLSTVEELGRGVRAHHPDVATYRSKIAEEELEKLSDEDRAALEAFDDFLEPIADQDLKEVVSEATDRLVADRSLPPHNGAPLIGGVDDAARITQTALGIKDIYDDVTTKGAETFDSKTVKTIRLIGLGVATGGSVTAATAALIRIFGFL